MKPIDIRSAVLARMQQRELTPYRLVKILDGQLPPASIYAYLAGTRDMAGERLGILLAALDMNLLNRNYHAE